MKHSGDLAHDRQIIFRIYIPEKEVSIITCEEYNENVNGILRLVKLGKVFFYAFIQLSISSKKFIVYCALSAVLRNRDPCPL